MRFLRHALAGLITLAATDVSAQVAGSGWRLDLVADRHAPGSSVPVSATPFDPTSLRHDRFFGREHFSSRAVAIELILNAFQARTNESLIYRPRVDGGYRVSSRWRLRLSGSRALLRYEIRF